MSTERWEIDSSHSGIQFSIRHLMIARVRGRFSRWSGSIRVPEGDWSRASVDVVIDASSIDTGVAARDRHLLAPEFLDVARYPDITFWSVRVMPQPDGGRLVLGELNLKGHRREVALEANQNGVTVDPWGNERAGFSVKASLDRRNFGLSGNFALDSGIVIGDRIEVEVEVEAVRQRVRTAA